MTKRMLVDASHPEEVRIAVVHGQDLIDLDIESASKKQIKGNIYLGRVTRVEPSLQAAFVDYNGGRQGFLSVSDIHSKYYPKELLKSDTRERAAQKKDKENDKDDKEENGKNSRSRSPRFNRRRVPIQKILQRNQTVLVQVVKEARGNKGASLTTNISLAGRCTVLLPENSGGGGISRKISDQQERKKLKELMASLDVPKEISLIIRTAGEGHNRRDITRDMNYLLRLWKSIVEKTGTKNAPILIHEEGDLIIRTIRDLYATEMSEILIEGQVGYRRGKNFMRLLMPSYVKVVQPYRDSIPLFTRYNVDQQIESMHERNISLKSGGYLVIEPTEAMVTIDINSGSATREKDIESTAFKTNIQAVDEIVRQLRLRDLGGLIVIDFIDMEDKKHNLEVERRLREAIKTDRAKIQLGSISQFGILELSRQRMKPNFAEANRNICPRCKGLGTIRSNTSSAIHLLRTIGSDVASGKYSKLHYQAPVDITNFLLNQKRRELFELESGNNVSIILESNPELETPDFLKELTQAPISTPAKTDSDDKKSAEKTEIQEKTETQEQSKETEQTASRPSSGRRRRGRRGRRKPQQPNPATNQAETTTEEQDKASQVGDLSANATQTAVPGLYVLSSSTTNTATSDTGKTPDTEEKSARDDNDEAAVSKSPRPRRKRRRRRRGGAKSNQSESTQQAQDQATTKQPMAQQPTVQQPTVQQPTVQKSAPTPQIVDLASVPQPDIPLTPPPVILAPVAPRKPPRRTHRPHKSKNVSEKQKSTHTTSNKVDSVSDIQKPAPSTTTDKSVTENRPSTISDSQPGMYKIRSESPSTSTTKPVKAPSETTARTASTPAKPTPVAPAPVAPAPVAPAPVAPAPVAPAPVAPA
ncbi:MAG: Rne/Rng family ribonuclease, partial [Magnetococcales bacterium]|nr:Rne/Rng family ribonuclease [Magnetococcales bacterium]